MYIEEDKKELISNEIKNLEKKSSAELVAVITEHSSSYTMESLILSAIITLFVSIITLFFTTDVILFLKIQVISFLASFFISNRIKKIIVFFLSKKYRYQKAAKYANEQFVNLGINQTKTHLAIMFFVSIDEKYVQIITDKNIKEKIEDSYWENIIKEFTQKVKKGKFSLGYIEAIKSCSEVLIEKFPIKENDKNEFSDEVIEL